MNTIENNKVISFWSDRRFLIANCRRLKKLSYFGGFWSLETDIKNKNNVFIRIFVNLETTNKQIKKDLLNF